MAKYREKATIMDERAMDRALLRIAHEIIERNHDMEGVAIIGIQRRGVPLSRRIARHIEDVEGVKLPVGMMDITIYRDDLSNRYEHPVVFETDVPFVVNDKTVIMVDDVVHTGRTARAAMEAIMDMGRPRRIQFAALIDRGHRELPIRPDYVGKNVPTAHAERISVCVNEIDGEESVKIAEKVTGALEE